MPRVLITSPHPIDRQLRAYHRVGVAMRPISWASYLVCNGRDPDRVVEFDIVNRVRTSVQSQAPCATVVDCFESLRQSLNSTQCRFKFKSKSASQPFEANLVMNCRRNRLGLGLRVDYERFQGNCSRSSAIRASVGLPTARSEQIASTRFDASASHSASMFSSSGSTDARINWANSTRSPGERLMSCVFHCSTAKPISDLHNQPRVSSNAPTTQLKRGSQ